MKEDLGNHSKDFHNIWCTSGNTFQYPQEIKQEFINLVRKYYQDFSRICIDRGWNLERRYSDCWYWRIGKCGRHQKNFQEDWMRICISCGRWISKIMEKRLRTPGTHSETWTNRTEWGFHQRFSRRRGRVSTCRTTRWIGSSKRCLFYARRSRLPSSHSTESSTFCANRSKIPYSTEMYWCHKVNIFRFGHRTRKTNWWLLQRWRKPKFVGFVDRFHEVYSIETGTSQTIHLVKGETDKNPDDVTSRSFMAWSLDKNWERRSKKRKTRMGTRKAKTWASQKFDRNLNYWSKVMKIRRTPFENARR